MTEEVKVPANVTGVADFLFFKVMEESGEAIQAISKMFLHGPNGKWNDEKTNLEHVSEELSDISTFIALLIDLELIDNKLFWSSHDKKAEKIKKKLEAMIEKEDKNNNNSDGRKASSD